VQCERVCGRLVVRCVAGASSHKDSEEGGACDHREILHASDVGLSHQQADMWGDRDYSQQETAQ